MIGSEYCCSGYQFLFPIYKHLSSANVKAEVNAGASAATGRCERFTLVEYNRVPEFDLGGIS